MSDTLRKLVASLSVEKAFENRKGQGGGPVAYRTFTRSELSVAIEAALVVYDEEQRKDRRPPPRHRAQRARA